MIRAAERRRLSVNDRGGDGGCRAGCRGGVQQDEQLGLVYLEEGNTSSPKEGHGAGSGRALTFTGLFAGRLDVREPRGGLPGDCVCRS